jgi:hypothetical protein
MEEFLLWRGWLLGMEFCISFNLLAMLDDSPTDGLESLFLF